MSGVRMRPAFKSVGRPSKLRQTSSGQEHRSWGWSAPALLSEHSCCLLLTWSCIWASLHHQNLYSCLHLWTECDQQIGKYLAWFILVYDNLIPKTEILEIIKHSIDGSTNFLWLVSTQLSTVCPSLIFCNWCQHNF